MDRRKAIKNGLLSGVIAPFIIHDNTINASNNYPTYNNYEVEGLGQLLHCVFRNDVDYFIPPEEGYIRYVKFPISSYLTMYFEFGNIVFQAFNFNYTNNKIIDIEEIFSGFGVDKFGIKTISLRENTFKLASISMNSDSPSKKFPGAKCGWKKIKSFHKPAVNWSRCPYDNGDW